MFYRSDQLGGELEPAAAFDHECSGLVDSLDLFIFAHAQIASSVGE